MDIVQILPDPRETLDAFLSLSTKDWTALSGAGVWCVIVLMPLKGVERRDIATAFTYMAFCVAAAVVLILAVPMQHINLSDIPFQLRIIAIAAVISGLRWSWRSSKQATTNLTQAPKLISASKGARP